MKTIKRIVEECQEQNLPSVVTEEEVDKIRIPKNWKPYKRYYYLVPAFDLVSIRPVAGKKVRVLVERLVKIRFPKL